MSIEEQILATMKASAEPMKAGELAEQMGIDKKEIDKALKKLKKEEKIVSPKRCFYEPA